MLLLFDEKFLVRVHLELPEPAVRRPPLDERVVSPPFIAFPHLDRHEQTEERLARYGLKLEWMGGRPDDELTESPTYFVLARALHTS